MYDQQFSQMQRPQPAMPPGGQPPMPPQGLPPGVPPGGVPPGYPGAAPGPEPAAGGVFGGTGMPNPTDPQVPTRVSAIPAL